VIIRNIYHNKEKTDHMWKSKHPLPSLSQTVFHLHYQSRS